jgi:hypothetical protein
MMNFDDEAAEIILELQKVDIQQASDPRPAIGDIVKWTYEWVGDMDYGRIYVVMGFKSENADIAVTRPLESPYEVREFHISQLMKL